MCENELTHRELDILKLNEEELSDYAVEMRLRLKKELAQRTLDRFPLSSSNTDKNEIMLKENRSCNGEIEDNVIHVSDSVNMDSSYPHSFHSPFDRMNLETDEVANMAAIMVEFSSDEFIPGERCEEKLLADESAWKKENIPPAMGPINPSAVNLDFSGKDLVT